MITCVNHRGRMADYHCGVCELGLCQDCINVKAYGAQKISVCGKCSNGLTELARHRPIQPFWTMLQEIFQWPFSGDGGPLLVTWGVVTLVYFATLRLRFFVGPFAPLFFILIIPSLPLYFGMMITCFFRVVLSMEDGRFVVSDLSTFKGYGEIASRLFYFIGAVLAVFWPAAALRLASMSLVQFDRPEFGSVLDFLSMIFVGFGLILVPMSLLLMGVTRNLAHVINPLFLFAQIRKIHREYFIALAIISAPVIGFVLVAGVFYLLLSGYPPPAFLLHLLIDPILGVLGLYVLMVFGHVLGYLAYQTRFKLGWWPETRTEPVFMIAGLPIPASQLPDRTSNPYHKTAPGAASQAATTVSASVPAGAAPAPAETSSGLLATAVPVDASALPPPAGVSPGAGEKRDLAPDKHADKVGEGMTMLKGAKAEDAHRLFQEVLDDAPNHPRGLAGMVEAGLRLERIDEAREHARRLGAELAARRAFDRMSELYADHKKRIPNLALWPKDLFMLGRWLLQQDRAEDAARTFRELGEAYPDDPLAPKAMYECAEILSVQLKDPEAAARIYVFILKRYPEFEENQRIELALHELKSG